MCSQEQVIIKSIIRYIRQSHLHIPIIYEWNFNLKSHHLYQFSLMKHTGLNLTKYVEDLLEISCKTWMKQFKEVTRDIPCSWIETFNIVKMSVLPNHMYRFNIISPEFSESYFVDADKLTLRFVQRHKKPRCTNSVLKEQSWKSDTNRAQDLL